MGLRYVSLYGILYWIGHTRIGRWWVWDRIGEAFLVLVYLVIAGAFCAVCLVADAGGRCRKLWWEFTGWLEEKICKP